MVQLPATTRLENLVWLSINEIRTAPSARHFLTAEKD